MLQLLLLAACVEDKPEACPSGFEMSDDGLCLESPEASGDTDSGAADDTDETGDPDTAEDTSGDSGTEAPTVCADGAGSYLTIQEAIDAASPGAVVTICPGTYAERLVISAAVELRGTDGAAATVVDGEGVGTVVTVLSLDVVTLDGLTLTGGVGEGGAIDATSASLSVRDCLVSSNDSEDATIRVDRGSVYMEGVTVSDNTAVNAGGLRVYDADATLLHTTFTGNVATGGDAGRFLIMHHDSGDLEIFNSIVDGENQLLYADGDSLFVVNDVLRQRSYAALIGTSDYWHESRTRITVENTVLLATGEGSTGIAGNGREAMTVEYNDFVAVTYPTCEGLCTDQVTGTNLEVDPRFVDEDGGDYRLDDFSLLLDAGNPSAAYDDADGTRNDMGAYGGASGAW